MYTTAADTEEEDIDYFLPPPRTVLHPYERCSVKISGGVVGVEPPLGNIGPPLQTLGKKAGGGSKFDPPWAMQAMAQGSK